jgi:hypothetical protein
VRQLICGLMLLMTVAPLSAAGHCLTIEVRGTELWAGSGREARFLINDSLGIVHPRWSPDRTRIAYAHVSPRSQDTVTDVVVFDTREMSLIPIANLTWEDSVTAVLRLGWHGNDAVWIEGHVNPSTNIYYEWNVTTKQRLREVPGLRFAWSPDGRHLAHLEHRAHFTPDASRAPVIVVDGRRIWSAPDPDQRIESPLTWSPDSRGLAFITGRGNESTMQAIDVTGREDARSFAVNGKRPAHLRWQGDRPVAASEEEAPDTGCGDQ